MCHFAPLIWSLVVAPADAPVTSAIDCCPSALSARSFDSVEIGIAETSSILFQPERATSGVSNGYRELRAVRRPGSSTFGQYAVRSSWIAAGDRKNRLMGSCLVVPQFLVVSVALSLSMAASSAMAWTGRRFHCGDFSKSAVRPTRAVPRWIRAHTFRTVPGSSPFSYATDRTQVWISVSSHRVNPSSGVYGTTSNRRRQASCRESTTLKPAPCAASSALHSALTLALITDAGTSTSARERWCHCSRRGIGSGGSERRSRAKRSRQCGKAAMSVTGTAR